MFKLLREDNVLVNSLVERIDSKILNLRRDGKLPVEYLDTLQELYKEEVIPWMKAYYLPDMEMPKSEEEATINKLLDFYKLLDQISEPDDIM